MFDELRKKAGQEPETKPAVSPKSQDAPKEETPPDETPTETETTPAAPEKKGKVSPWKLMEEHKAARLKAEAEMVELRKTMADPAKVKEIEEKYATVEKRAKELEDHIRFVDYSKSQEFQDKYQKPYEEAWKKHMGDLGELTVRDEAAGTERPLAPQDMLELVNMPLQKAREQAENLFGSFANDVMAARKEIRSLFEAQNKALDDARKGGAERQAQMQKQMQEHQESLRKEVGAVWTEANKSIVTDEKFGTFFKPMEGDEEGNKRLAKGYEMADRAFAVSPTAPNLTPDQRAEVVRLHAAVRNRSAAFGRTAYFLELERSKTKALTAELNKFKSAEPGAGERKTETPSGPTSAHDSVFAALRAKAQ